MAAGYFGGGYLTSNGSTLSTMDKVNYSTDTTTYTPSANLISARSGGGATGNWTAGYFGGGNPGPLPTDKCTYSSGTTAALPSSANLSSVAATGNSTAGYFAGGSPASSRMDKLTYSTETAAYTPSANLSSVRFDFAATGNTTAGYFGGGYPQPQSKMDKLTYSTDTTAYTPGANLTEWRYSIGAAGNLTNGYFGGGEFSSTIDKVTYSTDTTALIPGTNLSIVRITFTGTGNSTGGYFGGGYTPGFATVSTMDKITYSTDTAAYTPGANLSVARSSPRATSPEANGLTEPPPPPTPCLSTSGPISLADIHQQFSGDTAPTTAGLLELGEYYGQDNAPTSGALSFSDFYGKCGIPTSGLQLHWDGQISESNTGTGGVEDIGTFDRNGTLTNGASYSATDKGIIVLDGTNDEVVFNGYKGVTGSTARTSIVFLKLDVATPTDAQRVFAWGNPAVNGQKWSMELLTNRRFNMGVGGGYQQTTATFTLNQWNMFSATWPGGSGVPVGQQDFTSSGTFTVPTGVTQVSAVVVGGGGGGGNATNDDEPGAGGAGGGLSYGTFSVTPGESLTVTVGSGGQNGNTGGTGGTSSLSRGGTTLLSGGGGSGGSSTDFGASGGGSGGSSGGTERDGGGTGGNGGSTSDSTTGAGGGGGAAGYSGNGGEGADRGTTNATAGSGGGGGGGGSGSSTRGGAGGGGVGILGQGANGAAGSSSTGGGGGSGGDAGSNSTSSTGANGGSYGGGGAGGRNDQNGGDGQPGAVRIIWGSGRSFPSTLTTDQTPPSDTENITLYHNAQQLVNYSTLDQTINTSNDTDVQIGTNQGNSYTDGQVAKVLIYNRELSHSEIAQIYNAKAVALGLSQAGLSTEAPAGIEYVTGTTSQSGGTMTLTGIQSGDVVLLFGATDSGDIGGNPTGWSDGTTNATGSQPDNDNVPDSSFYYIVSSGTSVSANNLTDPNSGAVYVMMAFRGVNTTTVFNTTTQESSGGSGNPDSPSITTTTNGCMIVSVGFLDDDDSASSATAPSGYTLGPTEDTGANNGSGATIMTAYLLQSTAGAVNPGAFSSSGNDEWKAYTIALNPA